MTNIRAAVKYALLQKTAASPLAPKAGPAPVTMPGTDTSAVPTTTPIAPQANPFMDQIGQIKERAKQQKEVFKVKQDVTGVKAEALKAQQAEKELEAEQQRIEQEKQQQQAEMMQAQQAEAQQAQAPQSPEAANSMMQAAQQQQQQQAMPKTAGAAPFYFGIPDLASIHMFQPKITKLAAPGGPLEYASAQELFGGKQPYGPQTVQATRNKRRIGNTRSRAANMNVTARNQTVDPTGTVTTNTTGFTPPATLPTAPPVAPAPVAPTPPPAPAPVAPAVAPATAKRMTEQAKPRRTKRDYSRFKDANIDMGALKTMYIGDKPYRVPARFGTGNVKDAKNWIRGNMDVAKGRTADEGAQTFQKETAGTENAQALRADNYGDKEVKPMKISGPQNIVADRKERMNRIHSNTADANKVQDANIAKDRAEKMRKKTGKEQIDEALAAAKV